MLPCSSERAQPPACTTCKEVHTQLDCVLSTAIQGLGGFCSRFFVPDTWVKERLEALNSQVRPGGRPHWDAKGAESLRQFRRATGKLVGFAAAGTNGWCTSSLQVYMDNSTGRSKAKWWQCSEHPGFFLFDFSVMAQSDFVDFLCTRRSILFKYRELTMYGRSTDEALQWPVWLTLLQESRTSHSDFLLGACETTDTAQNALPSAPARPACIVPPESAIMLPCTGQPFL